MLAAIDGWTDPPIMRKYVNDGTLQYLAWREKHEGDSELDEFFDSAHEYTNTDDE